MLLPFTEEEINCHRCERVGDAKTWIWLDFKSDSPPHGVWCPVCALCVKPDDILRDEVVRI